MWPSLLPHFWIPFFWNAGPTGQFGGGVTAGTDALQRFSYAADLLVSPQPLRVRGDLVLITAVLGNPTLDGSVSSAWLDVAAPPGVTRAELNETATVGAPFVRRRWRSLASARLATELERFRYTAAPDSALAAACPACLARDLIGGSATLALSRVVAGALSVSPEDGFSWSLTYRRRDERGTGRWSNELRSQLALYAHVPGGGLGGVAHSLLAARLAARGLDGALRSLYRGGGVSSGGVGLAGAVPVTYNLFRQLRLGLAEPLAAPPSGAARRASVYFAFASDF